MTAAKGFSGKLSTSLLLALSAAALLCAPALAAAPKDQNSAKKSPLAAEKPAPAAKGRSAWTDYKGGAVGRMQLYDVQKEDTFVQIARTYNLGYVELRAANPAVDPWLPGAETELLLPTMHILPRAPKRGIVVNLPEMRLFHYEKPGEAPHSYSIGIGREGLNTPTGTTKVIKKVEGPTWRPTARMRLEDPTLPEVVPPGPANPMGTHALYTTWGEYRIHGTDKPFGIGRRVSSGCMRLYPEGIVDLYKRVEIDTPVTVVNQPVKAAWIGEEFYLEAHPSIEQADQMEEEGRISTYRLSEDDFRLILEAAGERADALDWDLIRETVRERRGYPVLVGRTGGLGEDRTPRFEDAVPRPLSRLAADPDSLKGTTIR